MVLYAEVNAEEVIEGECRLESGVPGRKDRGDSEEFWEDDNDPVYAGRIPGSPGV